MLLNEEKREIGIGYISGGNNVLRILTSFHSSAFVHVLLESDAIDELMPVSDYEHCTFRQILF